MLLSYRDIRLHSFSIFIPQNKRMFAIAFDIPDHGIIYENESTLNVFCSVFETFPTFDASYETQ